MSRRYRTEDPAAEVFQAIFFVAILYLGYLAVLYYTNRNEFWQRVVYGAIIVVAILTITFFVIWLRAKLKRDRFDRLFTQVEKAGLENEILNFINRFGRERSKNVRAWEYRGYRIDWSRINEVMSDFKRRGVDLTHKQFNALLQHYIDEKENDFTIKSIRSDGQDFSALDGPGFEGLLQQLYEKMGYAVRHTGRTGDQGGDLVITNGAERILVQAKRYLNMSVGNDAVQQAVAAKGYYDCNKAAVVTTSAFTKEAIELAKVDGVELIPKKRLQELLLQHLSQSWN
jgi:HJR/Mrr/RecB family endonuclease